MDNKEILYRLLLIRGMEQKIETLFSEGKLRGTTHCCIGQEGVPVALSYLIDIDKDYLCSGHRAHGLSMMMTNKPETLLGEIMGKPFGMAKGLGGSQHVYYKNYFTNGITGGMCPVAVGIAFTLKKECAGAVSTVVFGDGAMNEGYVLESFNLAAEMQLPVLFILENNGYAMSTPVESVNSFTDFEKRVAGFGIPYTKVQASDFGTLFVALKNAVDKVRASGTPQFVEVMTHRFCGHSKSDRRLYIPKSRDDFWHDNDIVKSITSKISESDYLEIKNSVDSEIDRVCRYCDEH